MDYEKLKSLLGNDDDMVERFLNIFTDETPKMLDDLNDALENEDWQDASRLAHSIKSQAKYLDLQEVASLAYSIEKNTENETNLDYVFDDFDELERAVNKAIDEIEDLDF